jgi:hypothetical protein
MKNIFVGVMMFTCLSSYAKPIDTNLYDVITQVFPRALACREVAKTQFMGIQWESTEDGYYKYNNLSKYVTQGDDRGYVPKVSTIDQRAIMFYNELTSMVKDEDRKAYCSAIGDITITLKNYLDNM